jgi:hypothetical protein
VENAMLWDVRYQEAGFMLAQEPRVHAAGKDEAEFVAGQSMRGQPKCRILVDAPAQSSKHN